jgi:hypothetical protein
VLLATAGALRLVGAFISLGFGSADGGLADSPFILSFMVVETILLVWRVSAVVLLASLLAEPPEGMTGERRNRRLGWISVGHAAVLCVSYAMTLIVLEAGEWIGLPEFVLLCVASLIAAWAFFGKARAFREGSINLLARREMLLAVASIATLVSYATAISSGPFRSLGEGEAWWTATPLINGVQDVVGLVAPLLAAIGFWISAKSLRRSTGERREGRLVRWFERLPQDDAH